MLQKNKLDFNEFFATPPEIWRAKILEELKTNSEQAIQWATNELLIQPFYTRKDLEKLSYLKDFHSRFILKSPRHWYTREVISVKNSEQANVKAQVALKNGADAVAYNFQESTFPERDLPSLLRNIPLKFSPVHFYITTSPLALSKALLEHKCHDIKGSIASRSLMFWMEEKNFSLVNIDELSATISLLKEIPRYKILSIDGSFFHNKECNIVKELAYSLSLALEYIDKLTETKTDIKDVLSNFEFSFSIGKNYFIEIAKLRAFRLLWNKICEESTAQFNSFTTPLHATTSEHYFSKEDPYQNLLHNTTEAMAAIIGGCDSLTIAPFDKGSKEENDFSSRVSRNISLILKEEAYFDKVTDPSAGSYYIENLTHNIAEKSWAMITEIEKLGGFAKAYEKGLIKLNA